MSPIRKVSFVVPARNEACSLATLLAEIKSVCAWQELDFEVIIVDDGSTDGTWREIGVLARVHREVRGVRLRRNFGKGPALAAGFKEMTGDVAITMDADLQDNPEDIPAFIEALRSGLDVVVGWRRTRNDPLFKRLQSRLFNAAVGLTRLVLHDHNCGFKAFRTEALEHMRIYGEMHRYMPILAHMEGWRVGEVEVTHRRRAFGRSNYGLERIHRGFFDLITILVLKGFRHSPMHLLGPIGGLSLTSGVLALSYLAALHLGGGSIGGRPLLIYGLAAVTLGGQLLATGVLAELLTAYMARFETLYSVREKVGEEAPPARTPLQPTPRLVVPLDPHNLPQ